MMESTNGPCTPFFRITPQCRDLEPLIHPPSLLPKIRLSTPTLIDDHLLKITLSIPLFSFFFYEDIACRDTFEAIRTRNLQLYG